MSTVELCEAKLEECLASLDPQLANRVRNDSVVQHEYFDDEDPKHVALKRAVEARRELTAARIRKVA